MIEIGQRVINKISGEKDKISSEFIRYPHDFVQDAAGGEAADMHVAHLNDGCAMQIGR